MSHLKFAACIWVVLLVGFPGQCQADANSAKSHAWFAAVHKARNSLTDPQLLVQERSERLHGIILNLMRKWPVRTDWLGQDCRPDFKTWLQNDDIDAYCDIIKRAISEAGPGAPELREELAQLRASDAATDDFSWLVLYERACLQRRKLRLKDLLERKQRFVFTKHFNMGGSHYAYTEAQSDAQAERSFRPGTALCIVTMDAPLGHVETLIEDADGVIRDPDVSYDGKRILFSWKKSDRKDDYHLYEMDPATRNLTQITSGLGFADYEGAYLPDGDIVFNSTRCVQTVDCWWTEVSNLYRCDRQGRFMRRLSFDQVHTNFPTVLDDGRIVYTRWDYNDRGQIYPQPLYQMNPDGTGQAEFYGNNSWFPTTILHARGIPGTTKLIAIATGHHTRQTGKLIVIDPARGNQENSGVQLIAPVRETPAERIDKYGQEGELFQYPYPLSEKEYIVTYSPFGWELEPVLFNIYYMTIDGKRELLVSDPHISCNQPIPISPRPKPHKRPGNADYSKSSGVYYVQDIYKGQGLAGVQRGTVKELRVVEIRFRAAGVRSNRNRGPAGGALVSTPIAIGNGAWDVKAVLGDAKVYPDGSACFEVPARTPVYFQALDEKGRAVQSMRTWSTLQPGETLSCVGCHEKKNETPGTLARPTLAMKAGPQKLEPFYGPPRGFSFNREIQPILDKHCIGCHTKRPGRSGGKAFSLLDTPNPSKNEGRLWSDSYLALTSRGNPDKGPVRWLNVQSVPPVLRPYFAGSCKSPLMDMLENGHKGVDLSPEELEKIACWIDLLVPYSGDYLEANCWTEDELGKYLHYQRKRDAMAASEAANIREMIDPARAAAEFQPETFRVDNPYRNLALNPDDKQGYARSWPHASSNSECRNSPAFAACNAIDGNVANTGHGPKFPSWGPDRGDGLWWKLDFGRMVEIDKLVVYIRADFPHDDYWHSATIAFSDGTTHSINIKKTAEPQTFEFDKRTVSWLKLTDLKQQEPLGWCAITEIQVWGEDLYPALAPVAAVLNNEAK